MSCHPSTLSVPSWWQGFDRHLPSGRKSPAQLEVPTECEKTLPGPQSSQIGSVADNTLKVGQYTKNLVFPSPTALADGYAAIPFQEDKHYGCGR
jgi:hypothetical protein